MVIGPTKKLPARKEGRFLDLAGTALGKRVWAFLNTDENLTRMATATDLHKPAVAGLGSEERLVAALGPDVTSDQWKRVIGQMVRQIMEKGPFELAVMGAKVGEGSMFSKGSRYRRRLPHWAHINVNGNKPDGGILWGDLGADDRDAALVEIEHFVSACAFHDALNARLEVRGRGVAPGAKRVRKLDLRVRKRDGLTVAQKDEVRAVLGSGPIALNVDIVVDFSP